MRKVIAVCGILIIAIFLSKVFVVAGFFSKVNASGDLAIINRALADPTLNTRLPVRDILDDALLNERKLMDQLQEKQKQLEVRENLLRSEEARLESLKKEIVAKIESLKSMEDKLSMPLASEDKKFRELAKVYETAPPAQVGSILEKMDRKTAAAIIMNMNNKKAGAVWGHISPAKAVEIAKEIAGPEGK